MMQAAQDFLEESEAIHDLLAPLPVVEMARETGFKSWTIDQIVRHLHVWNMAAHRSLTDPEAFDAFIAEAGKGMRDGRSFRDFEADYLNGLSGQELVAAWRDYYRDMAQDFGAADPSARVKWVGPSMSVRSSISARLMENWAHAQAIYDELGVERANTDRIRHIVVIGRNTYGWTFKVNREEVPEPAPYLKLVAPSGEIWEHNDPSETERIEGAAEEFCQVVTQVRNIADTDLAVTGPNAARWMRLAQCFAGGPETPPAPGARRRRVA